MKHVALTQALSAALLAAAGWVFWAKRLQLPACEMTYVRSTFQEVKSPLLLTCTGYKLYKFRDSHNPGPKAGDLIYPGLFVPGNAGKYIQIRPLASETSRHWARLAANETRESNGARSVYIQWYSVDTREELCAFDGDLLERQVRFVVSSLRYLQHEYKLGVRSKSHPTEGGGTTNYSCKQGCNFVDSSTQQCGTSVNSEEEHGGLHGRCADTHPGLILLGHSFGGVVAHAAMVAAAQRGDIGPHTVAMLLTTSSPHQRPPIPSHPSLKRFYNAHAHSTREAAEKAQLGELGPFLPPAVSLNSDYNDTQVGPLLTSLAGLHPQHTALHASTLGVPGTWAAIQHVCLNWCNQLLQPLSKLLVGAASEALEAHRQAKLLQQQQQQQHSQDSRQGEPEHKTQAQQGGLQHLHASAAAWGNPFWRYAVQRLHGRGLGPESAENEPACLSPTLGTLQAQQPMTEMAGELRLMGKSSFSKIAALGGPQGALLSWHVPHAQDEAVCPSPGAPACSSSSSSSSSRSSPSFTVLASGLKPCTGLRAWVSYASRTHGSPLEAEQAPSTSQHSGVAVQQAAAEQERRQNDQLPGSAEEHEQAVEVTHLAAWLPTVVASGRRAVRDWSKLREVMAGLDFNATSGWAWVLPPPLLDGATTVTLWIGTPANLDAFFLSAQPWFQPAAQAAPFHSTQQHAVQGGGNDNGALHIGWQSWMWPQMRQQGGHIAQPIEVQLLPTSILNANPSARISWEAPLALLASKATHALYASGLTSAVSLSVRQLASISGACTHPVLVQPDHTQGGANWGTGWQTSNRRRDRNGSGTGGDHNRDFQQQALPYIATANLTTFSLAPCLDHPGAQGTCRATLVLDSACSYALSLQLDLANRLPNVVLSHAHALWAMVQVLLLLVAAHQMEAWSARGAAQRARWAVHFSNVGGRHSTADQVQQAVHCSSVGGQHHSTAEHAQQAAQCSSFQGQHSCVQGQEEGPFPQHPGVPRKLPDAKGSPTPNLDPIPRALSSVWASFLSAAFSPAVLVPSAMLAAVLHYHPASGAQDDAHIRPSCDCAPAFRTAASPAHVNAAVFLTLLPILSWCCSAASCWLLACSTPPTATHTDKANRDGAQLNQAHTLRTLPQRAAFAAKQALHQLVCVIMHSPPLLPSSFLIRLLGSTAVAALAALPLCWLLAQHTQPSGTSSSSNCSSSNSGLPDTACELVERLSWAQWGLQQLARALSSSPSGHRLPHQAAGTPTAGLAQTGNSSVLFGHTASSGAGTEWLGLAPLLPLDALLTFPLLSTSLALVAHALACACAALVRAAWWCCGHTVVRGAAAAMRLVAHVLQRGVSVWSKQRVRGTEGYSPVQSSVTNGAISGTADPASTGSAPRPQSSSNVQQQHDPLTRPERTFPLVLTASAFAVVAACTVHISLGVGFTAVLLLLPAYCFHHPHNSSSTTTTTTPLPSPSHPTTGITCTRALQPLLQCTWLLLAAQCTVMAPSAMSALSSLQPGASSVRLVHPSGKGAVGKLDGSWMPFLHMSLIGGGGRGSGQQECFMEADASAAAQSAAESAATAAAVALILCVAAAGAAVCRVKPLRQEWMDAGHLKYWFFAVGAGIWLLLLLQPAPANPTILGLGSILSWSTPVQLVTVSWLLPIKLMTTAGVLGSLVSDLYSMSLGCDTGLVITPREPKLTCIVVFHLLAGLPELNGGVVPLVLACGAWVLPLLLHGRGGGRVVPDSALLAASGGREKAHSLWCFGAVLFGDSDEQLVLRACAGPMLLVALWGQLWLLERQKSFTHVGPVSHEGGAGSVAVEAAAATAITGDAVPPSEQGISRDSNGTHVQQSSRQGSRFGAMMGGIYSWLEGLPVAAFASSLPSWMRLCACAAFGAAVLGLDFAPYYTQAAAGLILAAWALNTLVHEHARTKYL